MLQTLHSNSFCGSVECVIHCIGKFPASSEKHQALLRDVQSLGLKRVARTGMLAGIARSIWIGSEAYHVLSSIHIYF